MSEIEKKALALFNEVARERGSSHDSVLLDRAFIENEALCRAIEAHEAFRQEVSDAVEKHWGDMPCEFDRFINAKPDPLVEVLGDMKDGRAGPTTESFAACLRAALSARGLEIKEIEN